MREEKERFYISPLRATEALQSIGEMYDRKLAKMYYFGLLVIALILGMLFEVHLFFLLIIIVIYMLCVPQLIYNQKKSSYEEKRFYDINSYMSQMAQSFIYTQDVIASLEETAACFPSGFMYDRFQTMFKMLESGRGDIKRAEKDVLDYIEVHYDCEKLRDLHNFFLNAEELGGDCKKEFRILESMRMAWQKVVEGVRIKRVMERNIGALIYFFFLVVCVIMLRIMRESDLDIMAIPATQLISTMLVVGFILYFVFMDCQLNKSLLVRVAMMDEESANKNYAYLENYNSSNERKKYRYLQVLSILVAVLFLYNKPDWITLAISTGIVSVAFNIHVLVYLDVKRSMRIEIAKAFPKWLFDVMLLLQRESVEGAIEKSIYIAPPILKRELSRMTEMLSIQSHNPDAYMSFLRDYNNGNIREIMHKLYSLAIGTNRDSEVLNVVIEKNIEHIEKMERDSLLLKDHIKSFVWIPFLCAGFGCIGYLVIAIMTSINRIVNMIGG